MDKQKRKTTNKGEPNVKVKQKKISECFVNSVPVAVQVQPVESNSSSSADGDNSGKQLCIECDLDN